MAKSGFTVTMVQASTGAAIPAPPAGCTGTTTNYYATAVPLSFGSTGTRSFATTEQGTIFYTSTAVAPADPIPAAATPDSVTRLDRVLLPPAWLRKGPCRFLFGTQSGGSP